MHRMCLLDCHMLTYTHWRLVNNFWLRNLQCTAAYRLCLAAPPLWRWPTIADMSQFVSVSVAEEAGLICVVRPLVVTGLTTKHCTTQSPQQSRQ